MRHLGAAFGSVLGSWGDLGGFLGVSGASQGRLETTWSGTWDEMIRTKLEEFRIFENLQKNNSFFCFLYLPDRFRPFLDHS